MPDIEVEIQLKDELLPQLIVVSAIVKSGQALWIENHCCLVVDGEDLRHELDRWTGELLEHYEEIVKAVVRFVPRSVYAPALRWEVAEV